MRAQTLEPILFSSLILRNSRFPPKKSFITSTTSRNSKAPIIIIPLLQNSRVKCVQNVLHFYHTKINLSNTEIIFRLILVVKFRFSPISAASIFRIRSKFWPRSGPIFALILIFSLQ